MMFLAGVVCAGAHTAHAEILQGTVEDALTGAPIEGAHVEVIGYPEATTTGGDGTWALDLPAGTYRLAITATVGGSTHTSELVRQYVPQIKPARARVYTAYFLGTGLTVTPGAFGLPGESGQLPVGSPDELPLVPRASAKNLTVSDPIPRRIRVGRRAEPDQGCRSNPIIAIEEMDIDEYVKGVLPPEIGVFRSIPGASEVYKAFGIAAKSYALWFMLYYDADNRRTTSAKPPNGYTWFHIDDTACNQRYSDDRLPITTDAAEAVADTILVKKGAPDILDKLEYAASCSEHGTLPEYGSRDALIPDDAPVSACVRSWCGHDSCAGHEDNPNLPGDDRCLVRGVCQWGSASWGEAGKDYLWLLDHYQPNLELRTLAPPGEETVTVQGYVHTDAEDPANSGVAGAAVALSDGQQTMSDAQGLFRFEEVLLSLDRVTVTVDAMGYARATREKTLIPGATNWASVLVMGETLPDMGMPPIADMAAEDVMDQGTAMTPADMRESSGTPSLGPLVTTSPGIDGGCGCRTVTHRPRPLRAVGALWCLISLGLIWRRRRR